MKFLSSFIGRLGLGSGNNILLMTAMKVLRDYLELKLRNKLQAFSSSR